MNGGLLTTLHIPFGATSTAAEIVAGVDLSGKRAIVTSGAGDEAARALALAGAEVTVPALDFSNPASIKAFLTAWRGPLDIFVCTASTIGLGHLALAIGLHGALKQSGHKRVVVENVLFAVEAARRWKDDGIAVNAAGPGAATSVLLAASPLVEGVTGAWFEDCRPHKPGAHDADRAARLWDMSLEWIGERLHG
jgi:NAD(P)-dependent dehydrogenase (short-subunit alcohol dehydrogenase family)